MVVTPDGSDTDVIRDRLLNASAPIPTTPLGTTTAPAHGGLLVLETTTWVESSMENEPEPLPQGTVVVVAAAAGARTRSVSRTTRR
jgi:hypothetical protein